MPPQPDDKRQAAREVIDILHEISTLLVCGVSPLFDLAFKAPILDFSYFGLLIIKC
jgi:hypothetical protein